MTATLSREHARICSRYLKTAGPHGLHIGCGSHVLPGWLNSDLLPIDTGVIALNACAPLPFSNATFDFIFSEHMIEHISFTDGCSMLLECRRALRRGGRIRISTPDLAFLVSLYLEPTLPLHAKYINWSTMMNVADSPFASETFVINNFVRAWGHTFIYDFVTLRFALLQSGFIEVARFPLGASTTPSLRGIENEGRMPADFLALESLCVEARNP